MLKEFNEDTRVVHCQKEDYDVYIGRPSEWGNPYTHIKDKTTKANFIVKTREEAVSKYREWVLSQPHLIEKLGALKGKKMGCWCKPSKCHGDVLVELINLKTELRITQTSTLIEIYRKKYIENDLDKRSKNSRTESSSKFLF